MYFKCYVFRECRETSRALAKVRRRSSESREGRKPRSPSLRRIGVIRRKSREREERQSREEVASSSSRAGRSPVCKAPLTPSLKHAPSLRTRPSLQRGQPNSTSSGLERPLASPLMGDTPEQGRGRIKMSFKGGREKHCVVRRDGPVRATHSPLGEQAGMRGGDSLVSLKNDISDLIERSFGAGEKLEDGETEIPGGAAGDVLDGRERVEGREESEEMVDRFRAIRVAVTPPSSMQGQDEDREVVEDKDRESLPLFSQGSPVTRSQLRRQSESFQFLRPAEVEQQVS